MNDGFQESGRYNLAGISSKVFQNEIQDNFGLLFDFWF